jgi:hypothetical protein
MTVRFVIVSDTHRKHWKSRPLPPGDVLVHAGDFTNYGQDHEVMDFNDWLAVQPHTYKVIVPGNHERLFEEAWYHAVALLPAADFVLKDKGVEVLGKKLWGSPYSPAFCDWAFGYTEREADLRWCQIPSGLDLLITHGPPKGIQDFVPWTTPDGQSYLEHLGCEHLRDEVLRAKPKHHVFGHIHEGAGSQIVGATHFHNVAQALRDQPLVLDI